MSSSAVMPPVDVNPDAILRLKTKRLVDPSNLELDRLFASEIAHYPESQMGRFILLVRKDLHRLAPDFDPGPLDVPKYCSSFDLVLPFLAAAGRNEFMLSLDEGLYRVTIAKSEYPDWEGDAGHPAKAAVIAMLRAAGWTIEFSGT